MFAAAAVVVVVVVVVVIAVVVVTSLSPWPPPRRYGEMPWAEAAAVNLKGTELPTELVIHDLVGSGRLEIASVTTAGRVLRVAGGFA